MPIYEYICTACDNRFELMRPISRASEPADCPSCHHPAPRVLSRFACLTTDESGVPSSIAGGGCAGCTASSCATCNN